MATVKLTDEEKKLAKEIFEELDTNKDGKITDDDIVKVMDKLGVKCTEAEAKALIADADKDKSGSVSFDEFVSALCERALKVKQARLRRAFQEIDTDKSGEITAPELKKLLAQCCDSDDVSDAQINEFIKAADKDGNGKISFEEFVSLWDDA